MATAPMTGVRLRATRPTQTQVDALADLMAGFYPDEYDDPSDSHRCILRTFGELDYEARSAA